MIKQLHKFLRSDGGNFASTFGITLAPILMSIGMAVDYSAYTNMDGDVQIASDSAMLHAAKQMQLARETDDADPNINYSNDDLNLILRNNFKPYFDANFTRPGKVLDDDDYTISFDPVKEQVILDLDMDYDTAVWQAFGKETMPVKVDMTVDLKSEIENYVIDIVMCIDATGSMQNTLNGVTASAGTFNADLRDKLNVSAASTELKVRIRPIFYRDWEESRDYDAAVANGNSAVSEMWDEFNYGTRYKWNNTWAEWRDWGRNRKYKEIYYTGPKGDYVADPSYMNTGNYYYFHKDQPDTLTAAIAQWEAATLAAGGESLYTSTPPNLPMGLNMYPDFIDMDPNASSGLTKTGQNSILTAFLGSEVATGGHDWPEAAGACLNEATRSSWYDNQSAEAREYFNIPDGDLVIADGDLPPVESYSKITPIPVVVFWTDASINSLSLSQQYVSDTTPTSYSAFETQWDNSAFLPQNIKLLIKFGPDPFNSSLSLYYYRQGWDEIKDWTGFAYGGELSVGNTGAANVIAEKVKEMAPNILAISS